MTLPQSSKTWILVLLVLAAAIFAIRITGPADLETNSQPRNIGYALDLTQHGNWLIQHDLAGEILSKPPIHTWLIGLFATPFGLNRVTMVLPSFLAIVAMTLLVFEAGRQRFGLLAGGLAGSSVILAPLLWKHVGLVRSDAVFSLAIAGGAWGAYRAWEKGKGWTLFWVCGALATLTKGPLGLLLSAAGLLAFFWENRTDRPAPRPRGSHLVGIILFFMICLSWMVPALWIEGRALIDKMIFSELLGHIASEPGAKAGGNRLIHFFEPTGDLLVRFAPFSIFAFYGIYRVFRFPAKDAVERRFERFLVCWFLFGLLIFSIAAHQRTDLLLPLWPAAALLSGRELARLLPRIGQMKFAWAATAVCVLMLVGAFWIYHPKKGKGRDGIAESENVRKAAIAFRQSGMNFNEIQYLSAPATFQYYLGTAIISKEPAEILADHKRGINRMLVATRRDAIDPGTFDMANIKEVFRWPVNQEQVAILRVFELTW